MRLSKSDNTQSVQDSLRDFFFVKSAQQMIDHVEKTSIDDDARCTKKLPDKN